jgi:hypothetical protein
MASQESESEWERHIPDEQNLLECVIQNSGLKYNKINEFRKLFSASPSPTGRL